MKKIKCLALAVSMLASGWLYYPCSVYANMHKELNAEEHVKELKDKLKLTSDQESKVRDIIADKHHKIEDATEQAHEKIRNLLNDDQRNKFNELIIKKEKDER